MAETFLLSINRTNVDMILSGSKKWEFRGNPNFGHAGPYALGSGDVIFVVSVSDSSNIPCWCRVGRILRGAEMIAYFGDPESGRWHEAGCRPGTARDWEFFEREILSAHAVAVELTCHALADPVPLEKICGRFAAKTWGGRGFLHATQLRRYAIDGRDVGDHLAALVGND